MSDKKLKSNSCAVVASAEAQTRETLRIALQTEGLEPLLCGDGADALETITDRDITCVRMLVIVILPKTDGFDLVRKLEESGNAFQSPVLMLTARGEGKWRAGSIIRLRADDYLEKPFSGEDARQKIHSITKHYRAHSSPHPVTGLPGHPQMEMELAARLGKNESFSTVWLDVNHFRPYNDHYGTEKGNEVIRMVCKMVQSSISTVGTGGTKPFIAHIDGDDFILIVPDHEAERVRQDLRARFQKMAPQFYSSDELKKGFFTGKGRDEKEGIFQLMNLSTAVVKVQKETFAHYGELVCEASELLRQAKVGAQDVR